MKTIIVEGCDRTGKNTVIDFITSKTKNYVVRHFALPQGDTIEEKIAFQKKDFRNHFILANTTRALRDADDLYYIMNRAHLGEWVYGWKYRNYQADWIWNLEAEFNLQSHDVYLIGLFGTPEFLIQQEDGHSISAKLKDREEEVDAFVDAFHKSIIPNKLIYCVNETHPELRYKPKGMLFNEITKLLQL